MEEKKEDEEDHWLPGMLRTRIRYPVNAGAPARTVSTLARPAQPPDTWHARGGPHAAWGGRRMELLLT